MTEYEPPYLCHHLPKPSCHTHPGRTSTPSPPVWETAEVKTWQPGLLAWLVQVSPLVSAAAPCSPVSLPSADCGSSFLFSKTSLPQGYHVVEFNVEKMERDISVLLSSRRLKKGNEKGQQLNASVSGWFFTQKSSTDLPREQKMGLTHHFCS